MLQNRVSLQWKILCKCLYKNIVYWPQRPWTNTFYCFSFFYSKQSTDPTKYGQCIVGQNFVHTKINWKLKLKLTKVKKWKSVVSVLIGQHLFLPSCSSFSLRKSCIRFDLGKHISFGLRKLMTDKSITAGDENLCRALQAGLVFSSSGNVGWGTDVSESAFQIST